MIRSKFTVTFKNCKIATQTFLISSMSSDSSQPSFEEIRKYLWGFGNGNVDLIKNEETGVATLTLNNPEKRNAISGQMMVHLRDHIEELEKWNTGKAVVLQGNNNIFCSGADLDFVRAAGTKQGADYMTVWMQDTLNRLQRLPLISVSLLEGFAIGGGAEVAVSCDYVVVTSNTKFGFVHAKMGLVPVWGGTTRLVNKIGQRKALDMLLTSKVFRAVDCLNIGLADAMVPTTESFVKTMEWLSPRIQHHHTIVRANKTSVINTCLNSYQNSLAKEKDMLVPFWGGQLNIDALNKKIKHKPSKNDD